MLRTSFQVACFAVALAGCGSSNGVTDSGYVGDTLPGTCTPAAGFAGNSKNVGAYCTQHGGQCQQYGLSCSIDLDPRGGNFCILVLCGTDADCGENACCTGDPMNPQSERACIPVLCDIDGGTCPAAD